MTFNKQFSKAMETWDQYGIHLMGGNKYTPGSPNWIAQAAYNRRIFNSFYDQSLSNITLGRVSSNSNYTKPKKKRRRNKKTH